MSWYFLVLIVFQGLWYGSDAFANHSRDVKPLLNQEPTEAAWQEWRALLFYHPNLWGGASGLIDSPGFYLSPNGKWDERDELTAFLQALFAGNRSAANYVGCRFPRRVKWAMKHLGILSERLPKIACPNTYTILGLTKVEGISLIFSSYFLESPASFFGHSFIRLQVKKNDQYHNPMLDPVINFSAVHGSVNYLSYVIGGLTGSFQGIFEILPMHYKLQQYANHESRDLWEYPLKLTPDQIDNFILTYFEVRQAWSSYYYLSRNCSLLLTKLLQAASSEVLLSARYRVWATPPDLLKRTITVLGDPQQVIYHPSNRSRYLHQYGMLTEAEREIFHDLWEMENLTPLQQASRESAAHILDTMIDYIDFDSRLTGAEVPKQFSGLRRELLMARSLNTVPPYADPVVPKRENPALMPPEQRFGVGGYRTPHKQAMIFTWRPTLKGILGNPEGSRSDMGLEMFNLGILVEPKSLDLLYVDLIKVENYQAKIPYKNFLNTNMYVRYGHFDRLASLAKGAELEAFFNGTFPLGGLRLAGGIKGTLQTPGNLADTELFIAPALVILHSESSRFRFIHQSAYRFAAHINRRSGFFTDTTAVLEISKNKELALEFVDAGFSSSLTIALWLSL